MKKCGCCGTPSTLGHAEDCYYYDGADNPEIERNIVRARSLLAYMSETEAAAILEQSGLSVESAFLAIKAAGVLNQPLPDWV